VKWDETTKYPKINKNFLVDNNRVLMVMNIMVLSS